MRLRARCSGRVQTIRKLPFGRPPLSGSCSSLSSFKPVCSGAKNGFVHPIKPTIVSAGSGRLRYTLISLKTTYNTFILLSDFLLRTDGPALALSFVAATPRYFSSFHSSFTALRDQPTTTNAALYNRLARPNHRLLPANHSLFPANDSLLAANKTRRRSGATKRPRMTSNADTL